jgi:hypothetical protein
MHEICPRGYLILIKTILDVRINPGVLFALRNPVFS